MLLKIADRIEQNLELLAYAETVDNGKPIRETLNADIPLASTTSATSPAACARRKAASARSTRTPSPTTSMSRWASSARSSRGTSRS
jgi:acyl-CoA reductase-like NAD-dependent aldehyde dehydrogenase